MAHGFSKKLTMGVTMLLVGTAIGFSALTSYAQTIPKQTEGGKGLLTFQSVCTTCHDTSRVKNYNGTSSWPEVINLMKSFGAFVTDDQAKEIADYLQKTYPR